MTSRDKGDGEKVVIADVNRYKTTCCGYLFNHDPEDLDRDQPTLGEVYGVGVYLVGECPGCRCDSPEVEEVGSS